MRFYSSLLAALVAGSVFSLELPAQDEKTSVMHAVALFIKDSLPPGPVLLDLDGVPFTSAEADRSARSLNAARGKAHGAVKCMEVQKSGKRARSCSIEGNHLLLEIQSPFILGNKAQTSVKYTFESGPDDVAYAIWELQLVRDTNATWRVAKVLARGGS